MDKQELTEKLKKHLMVHDNSVIPILVDLACQNVVNRRYPFGYTDVQEKEAISRYFNVVFRAVTYAYEKGGVTSHASLSENGTSRSFIDEATLYDEIVPICGVM